MIDQVAPEIPNTSTGATSVPVAPVDGGARLRPVDLAECGTVLRCRLGGTGT